MPVEVFPATEVESLNGLEHVTRWEQVVKAPPVGLHIVVDDQVGEGRGGLRALALLRDLGLRSFTFVRSWRTDFAPVEYDYVLLHPDASDRELLFRGHLVQVLTQDTELYSPHGFTADLLFATLSSPPPQPLFVLVVDSQDFHLQGTADGKSMIENFGLRQRLVGIHTYEDLYHRYRKLTLAGSPLSDGLTMNPWFHRLATELKQAGWTRFGRITDLFTFTERGYPLTPTIRALLSHFLDHGNRAEQLEAEGPEYVRRELKPWMEAGEVMSVARSIWWGCNVIDYDLSRLKERSVAL